MTPAKDPCPSCDGDEFDGEVCEECGYDENEEYEQK